MREILQHALQMLPDTMELDSKLAIHTDGSEAMDTSNSDQQAQDPCSPNDRIMCKIIDEMTTSSSII